MGGDGQTILWDLKGEIRSSDGSNMQDASEDRLKQALVDVSVNPDATLCCSAAP